MAVLSTNLLAVRTELADMIETLPVSLSRIINTSVAASCWAGRCFFRSALVDCARVEVQASKPKLWRLRPPMS